MVGAEGVAEGLRDCTDGWLGASGALQPTLTGLAAIWKARSFPPALEEGEPQETELKEGSQRGGGSCLERDERVGLGCWGWAWRAMGGFVKF